MRYRTVFVIRHVMHDDRLADVYLDNDTLTFEHRAWRIHPALTHAMATLSAAVAATGALTLDPDAEGPPKIQAWLEAGNLTAPMVPVIQYNGQGLPLAFEIQVKRDMIDPVLLREMNEHVFPVVSRLLVPASMASAP